MRIFAYLLMLAVLSGCATAYQPQSMSGGFSSTQLDTNVFQVTFKGNGYTDRDKANDFALLRSAELALENGYKYFVIVDAQQYSKDSTHTTPTRARTNINTNRYGSPHSYGGNTNYYGNTTGTATTTVTGGETYNISKPRTTNTIVCFSEKPEGFSYNAEFVAKNLKDKYGINAPNQAPKPTQ